MGVKGLWMGPGAEGGVFAPGHDYQRAQEIDLFLSPKPTKASTLFPALILPGFT